MIRNKKGSTLTAAIIVVMVIMIVLGASLTIASSSYHRSVNENTRKQLYLSCRSSAEVLSAYVIEQNDDLFPSEVGEVVTIDDIAIDDDVAKKSGTITRIDETTIKIVVNATFNDISEDIQIIMTLEDNAWGIQSYCDARDGDALC